MELNKEELVQKYGVEVASRLLSIDADIHLLYEEAVDTVGRDPAKIAELAEPLCQLVVEAEKQRRRRQWQRLVLCLAVVVIFLSVLIAWETSCRFMCAIARILWIKVD